MNETAYVKPNGAAHEDTTSAPMHFEEVRETVRRSDDVKELVAALIKAQIDFTPVLKDNENEAYSRGQKKSKYATLASVIEATRPALNKNGLTIVQHVQSHNSSKETIITTTLFHISGQFLESDFTMPSIGQNGRFDPQTVASATTYGRRYAWLAITGAAPEDDDGNAASGIGTSKAAQDAAKAKLEESARSSDPKVAAMAKEGLAKINAQATSKDLEGTLKASLEAQKDQDLFDEVTGTLLDVRDMVTSPAQGSRPYKKLAIAQDGIADIPMDIEVSAFDNLVMSDCKLFEVLTTAYINQPITVIVERKEVKGKTYRNLKDLKRLGSRHWDARLGVVHRND